MSDAMVATPEMFTDSKISTNKKEVIKSLEAKLQVEKCNLLKKSLTEMNILYDDSITDVSELLKSLKKTVSEREYILIEQAYEKVTKQLDTVCDELKNGSMSAFTKFVTTTKEIATPLVDSSAVSMAFRTAILASPTIELKVISGAASLLYSGYRLVKNDKQKKLMDKEYEIDRMLLEIELTKDENGKILDTRFSEKNQEIIREYLKEHKVEFNDTGYLSLRQAMNKLDSKEKLELLNRMINMNGYDMNSNNRLEKYNDSFFESFKKNAITPIAAGAAAGVGVATTVNATVGGDVVVSALSGTVLGTWLLNKTKKGPLSALVGTLGGTLTELLSKIPFVGEYIDETYNTTVLGLGGVLGVGIGIAGAAATTIIKAIKNAKERMKYNKELQEMAKVEEELYAKQDQEEIIKMRDYLLNNPTPEQTMIIEMVKEYMEELGINYRGNPKSILELKQSLNELDDKDKDKVFKLLEELDEENKKDPNKFKETLKKVGNTIRNIAVYGLASLSVVDIFTGGKFFNNLNMKYAGKEDLAKKASETKTEADAVYQEMLDKGYLEGSKVNIGIGKDLDTVNPDTITDLFGQLTYDNIQPDGSFYENIIYNGITYTNKHDLFNAMETQDLFALLIRYKDPTEALKQVDATALEQLRDFISNSTQVDKSAIHVRRMIDYFNEYLPNYNQTIEGMPELINKHDELVKMLDEYDKELNNINKTIDTGRTIANITTPIVAYEELENNRQK